MDLKNKIREYCCGKSFNNSEQTKLLQESVELTKFKTSANSGRLSEWYVEQILKDNFIKYKSQPRINYGNSKYIKPDFYLPDQDIFIEVKSRSYNMSGTANEKLDHVPRKYMKLKSSNDYKNSKLLIVCCAAELLQDSTMDLIKPSSDYVKRWVVFQQTYGNLINYVSVNDILNYIK